MKGKQFSPERKDRIKKIRSIFQGIILFALLICIVKALFVKSTYKPYSSNIVSQNRKSGFISISYFGVDRAGNNTLISTDALENQLKALKENGYVTITQNDILNYYKKGKALPEKSLFLLFEDGRTDTAIFSQKILEKYNYKATMLTYVDKFAKNDSKFLMPKDLLKLKNSSYWELGTNGYRLEFINVFDRNSNYLGSLDSVQFSKEASKINRKYNHYLMDYIRDENGIPLESYDEMKQRIDNDYKSLYNVYNKDIGYVPTLYALMHSNTGKFGTNDKVSEINGKWIEKIFSMNFNREGYSLNLPDSSIYDLTRVQPQAYWSTNHLLMRIWDDTKKDVKFVVGNREKANKFEKTNGQAEFIDDKIVLTSNPKGKGLIKLKNSQNYKDIKVSTMLNGNIIGSQSIYLRSNDDGTSNICVQLINDTINIIENSNGNKNMLYSSTLNNNNREIDIKESGSKKMDITLVDKKLTLSIDGKRIVEDLKVNKVKEGSILLESAWGDYGYSQRNIADDVYDAVFKSFKVTNIDGKVLYDSSSRGMENVIYNTKNYFNEVVNWFIKNL
ncbi:glycoside hydrolase [Clostridium scatologenes]|uniref:Glycoside hydrolase n=1 Tax=Clostridium scatologenes TaxID=1548 RepID=A0A0E3JNN0_CLOSL|nr:glycoside hydrolase [Clostridium scatologenes]AKA69492.1 hypothetical protein CSCA_2367 [Clostridium scatologenes]